MDILQENFPQVFNLYSSYYTSYAAYIRPLQRTLLIAESYFYRYLFPTLYPILALSTRIFRVALTEQPSLVSLALLAILLVISLKVFDMVRRTVIYWISLAIRLIIYVGVVIVGMWVYQRGVEQSLEDLGWLIGLISGLSEQGERVGHARAAGRTREATKIPKSSPRGRTRGSGW
ncbi:MAG: hypothetical protein L6R41_000155 [Letrouitia leprolyta]|nr:MAG: hypothetical protein L6R41_000155 [Letrouitia leprolyta]